MNGHRNKKVRYNNELLQNFCETNCIILIKDYSNEKLNRDSIIEGKCKTENCNECFKKTFRIVYNIKGFCENCTRKNGHEKNKNTCITRYSVKYPLQSKEVKDKCRQTCMKKYRVEYPTHSQEVKDKVKSTCLERYGVEYPTQLQEVRDKSKQTCLKNYGVSSKKRRS